MNKTQKAAAVKIQNNIDSVDGQIVTAVQCDLAPNRSVFMTIRHSVYANQLLLNKDVTSYSIGPRGAIREVM